MQRTDDRQSADELIAEWHEWCNATRDRPYSRERQMQLVELCIDQLPADLQRAIGIEMQQRTLPHPPPHPRFSHALDVLIPFLRRRNLIA